MNINYCSICSTNFDFDIEGDKGMIGLVPFAFCDTCKAGVVEYVENRAESREEPVSIPWDTFKRPVCRGAAEFGNNCGLCEKCVWLREHGREVTG